MFDGVLDQRLEDEGWDKRRHGFRLGVDLDLQAISETYLFDFQVTTDELKFFGNRDFGSVGSFKTEAQKITQASDHAIGIGVVAFGHQGRDCVQSIEKKMRFELRLQRSQAGRVGGRLRTRDAQTLRFEFDPVVDAVIKQRPREQDETVVEQGSQGYRAKLEREKFALREVVVELKKNAMKFAPDGGSSERDCDYENGGGERRHPVCARVSIEKTQCQGENKADYHEQHFVDDRFADGEGVEAPAKHGDTEKEPSAELEGPEERRFLEGTRDD